MKSREQDGRFSLREGGRVSVVLLLAGLLALAVGGCGKEGEQDSGYKKVVWSGGGERADGDEKKKAAGGKLPGFLRGGGEDLWREGCDHAVKIIMKKMTEDLERDTAGASPEEVARLEQRKLETQRGLKDASRECFEEMSRLDSDAADSAARCFLEAKDMSAFEFCAKSMNSGSRKSDKKEEKK